MDPLNFTKNLADTLIKYIFPAVVVFGVVWAIWIGIQFALADDEGKRNAAKKRLMNAVSTVLILVVVTGVLVTANLRITSYSNGISLLEPPTYVAPPSSSPPRGIVVGGGTVRKNPSYMGGGSGSGSGKGIGSDWSSPIVWRGGNPLDPFNMKISFEPASGAAGTRGMVGDSLTALYGWQRLPTVFDMNVAIGPTGAKDGGDRMKIVKGEYFDRQAGSGLSRDNFGVNISARDYEGIGIVDPMSFISTPIPVDPAAVVDTAAARAGGGYILDNKRASSSAEGDAGEDEEGVPLPPMPFDKNPAFGGNLTQSALNPAYVTYITSTAITPPMGPTTLIMTNSNFEYMFLPDLTTLTLSPSDLADPFAKAAHAESRLVGERLKGLSNDYLYTSLWQNPNRASLVNAMKPTVGEASAGAVGRRIMAEAHAVADGEIVAAVNTETDSPYDLCYIVVKHDDTKNSKTYFSVYAGLYTAVHMQDSFIQAYHSDPGDFSSVYTNTAGRGVTNFLQVSDLEFKNVNGVMTPVVKPATTPDVPPVPSSNVYLAGGNVAGTNFGPGYFKYDGVAFSRFANDPVIVNTPATNLLTGGITATQMPMTRNPYFTLNEFVEIGLDPLLANARKLATNDPRVQAGLNYNELYVSRYTDAERTNDKIKMFLKDGTVCGSVTDKSDSKYGKEEWITTLNGKSVPEGVKVEKNQYDATKKTMRERVKYYFPSSVFNKNFLVNEKGGTYSFARSKEKNQANAGVFVGNESGLYGNLDEWLVGRRVKKGDFIGYIGGGLLDPGAGQVNFRNIDVGGTAKDDGGRNGGLNSHPMEYPTFTAAELLEMLTLPGLPDINAVKDLFENTIKAPLQLPVNGYNTVASIVNDMLGLLNVPGEIYNGIVGVAFDLIIDNLVNPPPPAPGPSALQGQLDEIDEWAEQQEIETGIPPDEEVVENMKRPIYAVLNPLLKEIAYFQEMKEKKMITSVIAKLPTINLDDYIPDLPDLPSGDTYVHSSIWPGNLEMTERHLSFKVFVKDGTNQSWDSVLQPNRGVNAKKTPINVWGDTENPLGFYALSKIKGGEWKDVIPALNKDSENMFYANRETVPLASSGNGNEKSIATVTMPWGSTVLGTSPVRWNTYGSDTVNLKASGGSANHAYGINITSLFGERNAPGSSNGDPVPGSTDHRGVDVTFRIGTNVPIFATASGVVTEIHSLNNTDSGYYVKIEHFQKVNGYRVMTSYSHLKDDPAGYLSVGQVVSMGTQVGVMGGTGGGTGIRWAIHLHFGLRLLKKGDPTAPYGIGSVEKNFAKNGNAGRALGGYVDPMPFINFG